MDRLQGYNTDGYEYRLSQIDRSNSKRLKWMMSEAKKQVEINDRKEEQNKKTFDRSINDVASLSSNTRVSQTHTPAPNNAFRPDSINNFKLANINNPFNKF